MEQAQEEEAALVIDAYAGESELGDIVRVMEADLSEPYSVFTYRYFLHGWPRLTFLARVGGACVGAVVCKLEASPKTGARRGYVAMLAVRTDMRRRGVGRALVAAAIEEMRATGADEVALETEASNAPALAFYGALGFIRERRMPRYYMNNGDAVKLVLPLSTTAASSSASAAAAPQQI